MTDDTHDQDGSTDTERRSGPYAFRYNDDADTITIVPDTGPPVVLADAGLDATWPEYSDVTIERAFCQAVGGHAYQITGKVMSNPPKKKRACKLCGHEQIERPKRWGDVE